MRLVLTKPVRSGAFTSAGVVHDRRGGFVGCSELGDARRSEDQSADELEAMWKGFITPDILVPPPIGPAEHVGALGVPHMYRPRLDYSKIPTWTYAADNTPLRKTLEHLDWKQVRDPDHMRVFVSASDIENGKTVYFSNLHPTRKLPGPEYPAVDLGVDHALASGSFPGGFPWTMIDGRAYWDGGITDNTPLHPVIDNLTPAEAESMPIFVIDVNTSAGYVPSNLLHVMLREFEMLLQNNLQTDVHRAARYAQFIGLLEGRLILDQKDAETVGRGAKPTFSAFRSHRFPGRARGGQRLQRLERSRGIRPCPERTRCRHHETCRGEPGRFHRGGNRTPPREWIHANVRVPRLAVALLTTRLAWLHLVVARSSPRSAADGYSRTRRSPSSQVTDLPLVSIPLGRRRRRKNGKHVDRFVGRY